ncbi:MAG: hypothetical protein AAF616_07070 [Bacteroidota bacterium]
MLLPEQFTSMSDGERIDKFVSARVPIAVYSSQDRTVDFAINTNPMQWISGDEEKLQSFYKGTFETLFDQVQYLQDTIRKINGRTFIVFEFIASLKEENAFSGVKYSKYYSYIQYTSFQNQILLFNLGCKPRKMDEWKPIAGEMMESVRIKE